MLGYVSRAHQSLKWKLFCSEYQPGICGVGFSSLARLVSNWSADFEQTNVLTLLRPALNFLSDVPERLERLDQPSKQQSSRIRTATLSIR